MIDRLFLSRIFLLLALLLSALGAFAAGDDDVAWIADDRGCKVANPFPQPGESIKWSGSCKNGLADGNGRYDAADGSWYEGEWKEGQPHGYGQYQTPDGRLFSGTWQNGVYEGDMENDPNRT